MGGHKIKFLRATNGKDLAIIKSSSAVMLENHESKGPPGRLTGTVGAWQIKIIFLFVSFQTF